MTQNDDIFSRKPREIKPKNSSTDDYLQKKNSNDINELKKKVLEPTSELKKGQNVRLHKETHALLKVIALEENREMYTIFNRSLKLYFESLPKNEQKKIWEKFQQMIDLKLIKL